MDSVNDHDQTDAALLASGEGIRTITYQKAQLSDSASALGTIMRIRLEKKKY